jgi:hypothetical protein
MIPVPRQPRLTNTAIPAKGRHPGLDPEPAPDLIGGRESRKNMVNQPTRSAVFPAPQPPSFPRRRECEAASFSEQSIFARKGMDSRLRGNDKT